MSNMTKTIAILGVVAGLGVAALPLSTYATPVEWKETGGSDTTYGGTGTGTDYKWVKDQTTIELTIKDVLSIESDQTKVTLGSTDNVNFTGDNAATVTVITKNSKGYNLGISGTTGTAGKETSLISDVNANDVIKAAAGTFAAPLALSNATNSEWGYSVAGVSAFDGGKYAGVTTNNQLVKTTSAATVNDGEDTVFNFAAIVKDGQPAGTYTGEVTFTATNNPNA